MSIINPNSLVSICKELLLLDSVVSCNYLDTTADSDDNEFIKYSDDFISITGAKNTDYLDVEILKPLSSSDSNPVICIDDDGTLYRFNTEHVYLAFYLIFVLNINIDGVNRSSFTTNKCCGLKNFFNIKD